MCQRDREQGPICAIIIDNHHRAEKQTFGDVKGTPRAQKFVTEWNDAHHSTLFSGPVSKRMAIAVKMLLHRFRRREDGKMQKGSGLFRMSQYL